MSSFVSHDILIGQGQLIPFRIFLKILHPSDVTSDENSVAIKYVMYHLASAFSGGFLSVTWLHHVWAESSFVYPIWNTLNLSPYVYVFCYIWVVCYSLILFCLQLMSVTWTMDFWLVLQSLKSYSVGFPMVQIGPCVLFSGSYLCHGERCNPSSISVWKSSPGSLQLPFLC